MTDIPKTHPRYLSLMLREKLVNGVREGLTSFSGLIAHGRGEAFDYLIGEKTNEVAEIATIAASASIFLAKNPVISVNGNSAALVPEEIVKMAKLFNMKIEVNLFHFEVERVRKIENLLISYGADRHLLRFDEEKMVELPHIKHSRKFAHKEGIYSADLVFVPLEDGDRCGILVSLGKKVITIDLNPLSRTAETASITIVDNIVRAVPNILKFGEKQMNEKRTSLNKIVEGFNRSENLEKMVACIRGGNLNK